LVLAVANEIVIHVGAQGMAERQIRGHQEQAAGQHQQNDAEKGGAHYSSSS